MSAEDNIQTAKDLYAAFNRGDRDAMTAALAENVEFESKPGAGEIPWAGVRHGHSGFLGLSGFPNAILGPFGVFRG